jgi:hypothetical protein
MDLIHLAIKVSKPKITLAYRFLVAAPAMMTNQSNLCYDKKYNRYEVTWYGVLRCTYIRRFLLHRTVTTQRYSSPNDNLGPCTTTMYPQEIDQPPWLDLFLLKSYASYTYG